MRLVGVAAPFAESLARLRLFEHRSSLELLDNIGLPKLGDDEAAAAAATADCVK